MNTAGQPIAITNAPNAVALTRPYDFRTIPPALIHREAAPRRTKIWEFGTNLHCSIIGTCLSTMELRQALRKVGVAAKDCTDHELHKVGVGLAGRQDDASRLLHKALDHRHKLAISQFAKADTQAALLAMWRDAVRRGDIPSAYWATLTHPLANHAVVSEAFGDVHMLSHLVGSANRADIKRLCVLETEKTALEAKVERQQQALHEAVVTRDAKIRELRQALADRIVADAAATPATDGSALHDLVADRERRLAAETRRRIAVEERLAAQQSERNAERSLRCIAEKTAEALRQELTIIEAALASPDEAPPLRLDGIDLLYVGGRPNQIAHIRALVEHMGGAMLHHDGGVENHQSMLAGLVSRCTFAVFPVDCISHDAANNIKALCRKAGKRYIPLRSAGATSLLAALRTPETFGLADAAD